MKITVYGTGYVGLVTAICLADKGLTVYCIDKDREKIDKIKSGNAPIYEPGLDLLLKKVNSRLIPTTDSREAIKNSKVIFIAVGTPFDGKKIDLSQVKSASIELGYQLRNTKDYKVVVIKSTVIPETTRKVIIPLVLKHSKKGGSEIGFCMNPEFLREGKAIEDFNNPDRIVLGVSSKRVEKIMRKIYSAYKDADVFITNLTTAEMIKYTANSFLALTISFSNEISRICAKLNSVDSVEVFKGVILDKRISPIVKDIRIYPELVSYLHAGCGFGGSCFPKDVKALESFQYQLGLNSRLINGILSVNAEQIDFVFRTGIDNYRGKVLRNIGILGTAFKPDTDDIRESPGIKLAELALKNDFNVIVNDFVALENTRKYFGNKVKCEDNPLYVIKKSDLIFITTIWDKYKKINDRVYEKLLKRNALVIDCRALYSDRPSKKWRIKIGEGK